MSASFIEEAPTEGIISGTKGYIRIPDFLGAQELHIKLRGQAIKVSSFPFDADENFTFEVAHAMQCIRESKQQSDILPLDTTTAMMAIMDSIRNQWGLKYPGE